MPDMTTIAAALTSFDALKNIAQAMIGLRDAQAFQAKLIEFNSALIEAQTRVFEVNEERSALIERVHDLEKQIADLEAWETEKQRYALKAIAHGSFAYVLKSEAQGSEPPHQICAACYQRGKKSILQMMPRSNVRAQVGVPQKYRCPACGSEILA